MLKNHNFVKSKILVAVLAFVLVCLPFVCYADDVDDVYLFPWLSSRVGVSFYTNASSSYWSFSPNRGFIACPSSLYSSEYDVISTYSRSSYNASFTYSYDSNNGVISCLSSGSFVDPSSTLSSTNSSSLSFSIYIPVPNADCLTSDFFLYYDIDFLNTLASSYDGSSIQLAVTLGYYLDLSDLVMNYSSLSDYYASSGNLAVGLYNVDGNTFSTVSNCVTYETYNSSGYVTYSLPDYNDKFTSSTYGGDLSSVSYICINFYIKLVDSTSPVYSLLQVTDDSIELFRVNDFAYSFSNYTIADAIADGVYSDDTDSTYCCCNCEFWLEQILAQTVTVNDNLNTIISKIGSSSVSSEASSALSDSVSSLDSASGDYTSSESKLLSYGDSVDSVDMDVGSSISEFSTAVGFWTLLFAQWTVAAGSLWQVFVIGLVLAFVFFILRINPHS